MVSKQFHLFHLVDPSPWPLLASIGALMMTFGGVMYFHFYQGGSTLLTLGLLLVIGVLIAWWRDVVREATYQGHHTSVVQRGLRLGMILFIVSEVMFFAGFFWAFFHSSLAPTVELGCVWPPYGIDLINPWNFPLLNTAILLLSGCTVTWAHHTLILGRRKETLTALYITLALAVLFTLCQLHEYTEAGFNISDSVYGSTFYMATGFHGFHVIIGTIFLAVATLRVYLYQMTTEHHFGFEAAAWYWHFVDVVWLFLFVAIYWWGSTGFYFAPYE